MVRYIADLDGTISQDVLANLVRQLEPEIDHLSKLLSEPHAADATSAGCIQMPFREEMVKNIQNEMAKKRALEFSTVVLTGIGGANLGSCAVYEALKGYLCGEHSFPAFYYIDTLDTNKINRLLSILDIRYKNGEKILHIIASKSGTTLETNVNASLLIAQLKRYFPTDYREYLVAVSDQGTPLHNFAVNESILFFEVPQAVEGRFSVFSPIGLVPLAALGIDIAAFCQGGREATQESVRRGVRLRENRSIWRAALLFALYKRGYIIHNLFLFDESWEAVGKWHRQLVAESLGKKHDRAGNVVECGIVPLVSIGTTDLHSMVQLYLGGPRHTMTTFVWVEPSSTDLMVPPILPTPIKKQTLKTVQRIIFDGVQQSYRVDCRPFSTIEISATPFDIGYFMQLMIFQVIYLSQLMRVNPFDQPAVHSYKQEIKNIMNI